MFDLYKNCSKCRPINGRLFSEYNIKIAGRSDETCCRCEQHNNSSTIARYTAAAAAAAAVLLVMIIEDCLL